MNSSTRKFFDVAHPGQAAPSATSRPVLSSPLRPDPMFSDKPAATVTSPPKTEAQQPSQPVQPEQPEEEKPVLDARELLIQAGQLEPPKASVNQARRVALIAMTIVLIALCAASYWLVKTA